MEEIWKDIPEYEGMYQISNLGRVKSLPRRYKCNVIHNEIIKVPTKLPNGYLKAGLCKKGITKYFFIHRLVAQAFIANPNNLPQINHKNEIKTDNRVENLEWVSAEENLNYGKHNLRKYVSLTIYNLKMLMPNEKKLINILEDFKNKI